MQKHYLNISVGLKRLLGYPAWLLNSFQSQLQHDFNHSITFQFHTISLYLLPGQATWKEAKYCFNHTDNIPLSCEKDTFIFENGATIGYTEAYTYSPETGPSCKRTEKDCTMRHPSLGVCTTGKQCYIGTTSPAQLLSNECARNKGIRFSNYLLFNYSCIPGK